MRHPDPADMPSVTEQFGAFFAQRAEMLRARNAEAQREKDRKAETARRGAEYLAGAFAQLDETKPNPFTED